MVETVLEDWRRYEHTTVYAGPAISYTGGNLGQSNANWWLSVTPTFQLSSREDEPDYVTRLIAGLAF